MRFNGTQTWGWQNAMIGMRLPFSKNYEDAIKKSDTKICVDSNGLVTPEIGPDDLKVVRNLVQADKRGIAGQPNSKVLRMIHIQVAVEAPLCWWKEMDTYKVGTVANSTSTMHRIQTYPIDETCFEPNPFTGKISGLIHLMELEDLRIKFNALSSEAKQLSYSLANKPSNEVAIEFEKICKSKKSVWYDLIYGLGDSWLQTRMFDLNYQNLREMVFWRAHHIQNCWSGRDNPKMDNFIAWARTLPYAKELLFDWEDYTNE